MKKICLKFVLPALVLICVLLAGYHKYGSSTRIAFVNYPEYVLAPLLDQPLNPAIEAVPVKWTESSGDELKNFDMVLFFGMGLNFTERQQELLSKLARPLYVTASTRVETELNTLSGDQKKQIGEYLDNGGKENFRRMLDFIRYDVDGKRLRAAIPQPPKEVLRAAFFHIAEDSAFKTYPEYLAYYKSIGKYHPENPTVCLLSGNGGGDLANVIESLEKRGLNVVAANGMGRLLPMLQQAKPDLVIYQPHGRLSYNDPETAIKFLKENNIPLFCPIKVNAPYEEWLKDQRGMTGGMLSQSIIMPELDGAAVPFVLSALFRNRRGLLEFRVIPDRLERFSELVHKTVMLKRKPNADKKIAIVYYKEPGKNALVAGGLEVGDSLLNTLKTLQKAGYTTGPLPETPAELNKQIQENAAVFGNYAEGAMQKFLGHATLEIIKPADYEAWVHRSLPPELYAEAVKLHGEFPGNGLRTPEGNLALGRLQFGNIVLIPQTLPGSGEDDNKLVHGVKAAPPHAYIATYLWLRHGFKADALLHFGTHGSLEFTPWKQLALSSYDWPDVLIGEMPHYYLYVINNIGEALVAKRRSYATMVSHLTAPFMNADSYGPVKALDEKIENWEVAENPALKAEYAKTIIELARRENFDKDLKLSPEFSAGELTEADLARLHNHLHEISGSKVNRGLYVIGRPYSPEEAEETAKLMTIDLIADTMFKSDLSAGRVKESQREDLPFFQRSYLEVAGRKIEEELKQSSPESKANKARQALTGSTQRELDAMINVFNGGYLAPSPGGDPIGNPDTVPTGRNLYGIDPERTPTRESYNVGRQLAEALIEEKRKTTGEYPKKVAFSLWGGEFIRTQGTNIGEIFYLLGVEPVWDSRGRVQDVRLIPASELKRPRIDVIVQTSGQFRGAATSRMRLIDKAVRLAAADNDAGFGNFVREGSLAAVRAMVENGLSPEQAKSLADARIFGGINGNFGTGVTGLVQSGDKWEDSQTIADLYLNNMGALYTNEHWGEHIPGVFKAALSNTDTVVQSRSSNSWGPLSLDHVYEFTGGINLAVKTVTGKEPGAYFNDLRTPGRAKIQEAGEAAMVEARSTLLNPKYVSEMMQEGPSGAATFTEAFRNTYGWEVMKPEMIDDHLWEEYKHVYLDDTLKLGVPEYFREKNPYAMQEMTAVMLETIRKGLWKADDATIRQIAATHAELVKEFGAGCSGFVCNNAKLRESIAKALDDPELAKAYQAGIEQVRTASAEKVEGQTLKEERISQPETEVVDNSRGALKVIAGIIVAALLALILGNRRKK